MVTTNGFPKCGNHALVKAVQLLGQPCQVSHIPFGESVEGKHVFIKRDPRNVICSWLRFTGQPVTPGMFLTAFRRFQSASLVEEMSAYEGWLSEPSVHVVRFEDLISDATCMQGIAAYLEIPYLDGAFENLPGLTRTWFPDHSDCASVMTAEVEAAWSAEGGNDLLARWGY